MNDRTLPTHHLATPGLPATPPGPEIHRDNLLDSIDDQVRSGHHALLIEGESGDGKTVLVNAYAKRHASRTIYIAVSAASKWGYNPHYVLQSIGMEIHRVLGLASPKPDHLFQESDLHALYTRLSRRGSSQEPILFLLDGVHEIPDEDDHLRRRLLDLIPLGLVGIKAILTDSVPSRLRLTPSAKTKTWRLTRFTLDESREYLRSVVSDPKLIVELHQLFKGRPGSLAVVHRMLSAGNSPQQLLSAADGELVSLLEREWASVGQLSDADLRVLGLLVLARVALSARDVARVLDRGIEDIESLLRRTPFVSVDVASGTLAVSGDTMRQFVVRKTERFKGELLTSLIKDLERNPAMRESLGVLPRYFQDAGRLEELVTFLTPSRLCDNLKNAESLRPLSESLDAGLEAATKLKRDGDSYRFSLQSSAITEIGSASSWDAQVNAVLALRDFGQAIQIAESVPLAKEKLLLLASVAAEQRRDGLSPPDGLLDRIRRLLEDVADSLGPEQTVALAGRLFAVMPDRATQLVQQASTSGRPGGTVDWAIAQLSIFTTENRNAAAEAGGSHSDVGAAMRTHIRDPDLRRFSTSVSNSLCTVSASDALTQSKTIANARDRIFFLRHWTDRNRQRVDAIEVTQAAIDLIIATTEYAPNAADVLRIARPLRFCNDEQAAMRCVSRISALLGDLAARGPTAELFRLRILLAATTFRWHREDGRTRFQEEYFAICDIPDYSIKAECLARLLSQLSVADSDGYLQMADQLHQLVEHDLRKCISDLLACTAQHDDMLFPVVAAIANTHPSLTEEFIRQANTLSRRDALRLEAIEHMLRGPASPQSLASVVSIARSAEARSASSACAVAAWTEIEKRPKTLFSSPDLIEQLATACYSCGDPRDRSICAALAYSAIRQTQIADQGPLLDRLRDLLRKSITEINDAWEATDAALEACTLLAKADLDLARECLTQAQALQRDRLGGRSGPTWLVIAPIKLALAALAGLMRKCCDQASDTERVLSLIACLPSAALRAHLRSELAVWFYAADRMDDCRKIVQSHLLPEIRPLEGVSNSLFCQCVMVAADAVFLAHPETAKSLLAKIEPDYRDMAIARIVAAKLNRLPASEPFRTDEKKASRLSQEDLEELIPLLSLADADSVSWGVVERLTSAMVEAGDRAFAPQQLSAVSQQLELLAKKLLPRKNWIQHRGYELLWLAAARRIRGRKLEYGDSVIGEAKRIDNLSDRSYMLAHLGGLTNLDASGKLLDEAAAVARSIPVEVERIERLAHVAETGMRLKRSTGTSLAKEVCRLAQSCDHGDMDAVRKRVIDAAYRIDRDLAGALAEAVDTDPARITARTKRGAAQLQEQLKTLEASRAIMDHKGDEALPPADIERLPAATWHALASLNAGRSEAKRIEQLRPYIRIASSLPLSDAYPIMAWILANARLRFEGTPQAAQVLRPFFDACSMVAEFSTANAFPTHTLRLPAKCDNDDQMLIRIGQQRQARDLLDAWIADHVKTQLLICDPYFSPDDLWVIAAVLRHAPTAEVVILTSRQQFGPGKAPAEEQFRSSWRGMSDQDPPNTEIIVCGFEGSGMLPIHDRWWLSDSAGLRPGTSLGGLGLRESKLSEVDPAELATDRAMIEEYTRRRVRKAADGRPILYSTFSL